jgi:predicted nucleotidyltransferase component of viral defense system
VIFKGGSSLAKGWNLIRRFSEHIDIFLDPLREPLVEGMRKWRLTNVVVE